MSTIPRPPIDPDLLPILTAMPEMVETLTMDNLAKRREAGLVIGVPIDEALARSGVEMTTHTIPSYDGVDILVRVFRKACHSDAGVPGIYSIHGGGMVRGDSLMMAEQMIALATEHDAVVGSIEYRLAPENPDPAPVEDCYAGLVWFTQNAGTFGFNADRVLVMGTSAGGGLAAGTCLLARDRQTPKIAWQLLDTPMLDDRDFTISSQQMTSGVIWDRPSNVAGWTALLGDRRGTDQVSIYAAPARATDLSGLPQTFIDVGSAEVFRDEAVEYAMKIWAAGGDAELHVWAGGFHGFALFGTMSVAMEANEAMYNWIRRKFSQG